MLMASMDLLELLIEFREWTVYGLSIYVIAYVTYDGVYYDVVFGSLTCFVDGCRLTIALLIRLTFGVKGSCMKPEILRERCGNSPTTAY
jgi:hypothetical protein